MTMFYRVWASAVSTRSFVPSACLLLSLVFVPSPAANAGEPSVIQFDLPSTIAADPAESSSGDPSLVTIELPLSSMITSPRVPEIDQWLVRCQARDPRIHIADYAPRTETASDLASPIQVKKLEEKSRAFGVSLDAKYPPVALGHTGADVSDKNIDSVEFQRHAAVQAVTAAGTINRGRGVYFKLRWTAQQVLEGEKVFRITFSVPQNWRGGLVDVSVIAQTHRKTFGGLDSDTVTLGAAQFAVAAFRAGDKQAEAIAAEVAEAEYELRTLAGMHARSQSPTSLPSMLRHVARKLDLDDTPPGNQWLMRLLVGSADPHLDKQITKLPMAVRIAALDYADVRDQFASLGDRGLPVDDRDQVLVAKPVAK